MNTEHCRAFYKLLGHRFETEIRLIDPAKKKKPKSEFVKKEQEFVDICKKYEGDYNIYAGINERSSEGTAKDDVLSVKTVVVDIDPVRDKDLPSTEIELQNAINVAQAILMWAHQEKLGEAIIAMSGNGVQLYFCIPEILFTEANKNKTETKLQLFQREIAERFNTTLVKIDNIGDLPRIIKVIGTKSIKGVPSQERPHRESMFISALEDVKRHEHRALAIYISKMNVKELITEKSNLNEADLKKLNDLRQIDLILDRLLKGDTTDLDGLDKSRSAADMKVICKLMAHGFGKDSIYDVMGAYMPKWKESAPAYRNFTYKKALEFISQETTEKANALLFQEPEANGMDKEEEELGIVSNWLGWFSTRSWNNNLFGKLGFYTLCGSILQEQHRGLKIGKQHRDVRIHIGLIQPPSSGKTEGCQAIYEVARHIKIPVAVRTKITSDASLTGTFREARTKAETAEVKESGEAVFQPGDLDTFKLIIVPEASNVLTSMEGDREGLAIQNTLLQAMDKGGIITKKKADSPERVFNTEASFILTSRETRELRTDPEILLKNGLAQRTLLIIKDVTTDEYRANAKLLVDNLCSIQMKTFDEKSLYGWFDRFRTFASTYDINHVDEVGKGYIKECINDIYSFGDGIGGEVQKKIYYSFVARYIDILFRLSVIHAYLRCVKDESEVKEIRKIDIRRSYNIVKDTILNLLPWFEENSALTKESNVKNKLITTRKDRILAVWTKHNPKNEWVYAGQFAKTAGKEIGSSLPTVHKTMAQMGFEFDGETQDPKRKLRLRL